MDKTPLVEHVGPRVEFGRADISSDEAEAFRQTALRGAKVVKLVIGEHQTLVQTLTYTSGMMSDAVGDYDVPSSAFYSKSILGSSPDYWRSVVTFARFNDKHRDTKIYNAYEVVANGGEPLHAVRRVRIIRNLARLVFDENGEPYEDVYSKQHKGYETAMTGSDVVLVDQQVDRIIRRNRATGGR
ncbi:MAG: hypothetical protein ACREGE_00940 [Candidatus Microsaccharimonas sp.]